LGLRQIKQHPARNGCADATMNLIWLPIAGLLWAAVTTILFWRTYRQASSSMLWRDLLAGGVLFLLTLGFFWRMLSGDVFQPADGGDLVSFLFPTYRFAASELAQGRLPLWNPTLYGGAPFIGDIQAGFLYLPNLLLFLIAPKFDYGALPWLSVLHLYWAGLGMYVLLRTLRWTAMPVNRSAALFGAVAFMFADPLFVHVGNLNLIAVLSWLPWVLAAYARSLARGGLRWALLAALLLGVSTYAGHAQSTLYVGLALALYTVGWFAAGVWTWRRAGAAFGVLALTAGLAVALAAPILLPAAELAGLSARESLTYQESIAYSLAPTQALVGLLTPGFFGRGPALHWSLWERVELPYVGIVTLIMAVVSLVLADRAARRRLWIWAGMALFGLLVALGVYGIVHGWLTYLLPFFDQLRAPARALVLWSLGLSVLAAVGVDQTMRRRMPPAVWPAALARFLRYGGLLLLGVTLPLVYFALLVTQPDATTFLRASLAALALALATAFWLATWAMLAAYRAGWLAPRLLGIGLVALLFFDLAATGAYVDISEQNPTRGFDHPDIVDYLRSDPDLIRIDSDTDIAGLWQPDSAALHGLQDIAGIANPLALRSVRDYLASTGGRDSARYDLLNVKYVLVAEGVPLPAGAFERVLGPVQGLELHRNLTYAPRAWYAPADADLADIALPDAPLAAAVTHYAAGHLDAAITAPAAGYLVLAEVLYPGWQAAVNGAPAALLPVNGALMAVPVPAGAVTVSLRYWPASFTWGLIAAAVALGVMMVLVMFTRSNKYAQTNTQRLKVV
jgi:hypothetical protein